MEQVACEDLKAFERRLTEIIASAAPSAIREQSCETVFIVIDAPAE
jgi:hypothetical protein